MSSLTRVPKIADFVISTLTAFVILCGPSAVTLDSHTIGGIFINSAARGKCKDHGRKVEVWSVPYTMGTLWTLLTIMRTDCDL